MNIALKEFAISKIICRTEGNQYKRQVAFMMVGPQGGRYIGNKGGLVMLQCPEYSAIVPITWIAIELQQTSFPQIIRTFSTETFVGGKAIKDSLKRTQIRLLASGHLILIQNFY